MSQVVNTNMSSGNAQRYLSMNQHSLTSAMQRLSSGLRINSAADDAAGLAISERFTTQIRGNDQAARNANDGISLAQTAEGDLAQIGTNLQRIRELAVQAANASNTASDRLSIDNEAKQLAAEIDRVAKNSSFNGIKLLDGNFNAQNFQVGANNTSNDSITITTISSATTTSLGGSGTSTSSSVKGSATVAGIGAGSVTLNGVQVGASTRGSSAGQTSASAYSIAAAINAVSSTSGVTATANATTLNGTAATTFGAITSDANLTVNGIKVGNIAAGGDVKGQGANVAAAINQVSGQSGVTASADATTGKVTLTAADGRDISLGSTFTAANSGFVGGATIAAAGIAATSFTQITSSATLTINGVQVGDIAAGTDAATQGTNVAAAINQVSGQSGVTAAVDVAGLVTLSNVSGRAITLGAGFLAADSGLLAATNDKVATQGSAAGTVTLSSNATAGIVVSGGAVAEAGLTAGTTAPTTTLSVNSISTISLLTATGASDALSAIDGALSQINTSRASLGAYQNRFASTISSLQITSENLTASRSRIQDADFAKESANLSRAQVLQQAGTAMLAQANQSAQGVLSLLR